MWSRIAAVPSPAETATSHPSDAALTDIDHPNDDTLAHPLDLR